LGQLFSNNPSLLAQVKLVYNEAIIWAFRTALITVCLTVLSVFFVENRSVKGKKIQAVAA
jgi:hypothetical protein